MLQETNNLFWAESSEFIVDEYDRELKKINNKATKW
jgi:hypothetical protein